MKFCFQNSENSNEHKNEHRQTNFDLNDKKKSKFSRIYLEIILDSTIKFLRIISHEDGFIYM